MSLVAIVPDLLFASKISAEARAQNIPVLFARTAEQLRAHLLAGTITHVLIDLNGSAIDPLEAIAIIKAHSTAPRVTAFASHVDEKIIHAARSAGADQALSRGAFSVQVARIIAS